MDYLTSYYMQLYLNHLHNMENCLADNNFTSFSSMHEHTHAFLMTLGIDEESAWLIIDDFKRKASM